MEERQINEHPVPENETEMLRSEVKRLSASQSVLLEKLNNMNMVNLFKRLDYLFKVMEFQSMFDKSFVEKCSKEIVDLMTIKEGSNDGNTESK